MRQPGVSFLSCLVCDCGVSLVISETIKKQLGSASKMTMKIVRMIFFVLESISFHLLLVKFIYFDYSMISVLGRYENASNGMVVAFTKSGS